MQRYTLTTIGLALLLVASIAYLSWNVWRSYEGAIATQKLRERLEANGGSPSPLDVDANVEEVRSAYKKYGDENLSWTLMNQLSYQAWFYPERSVKPMRESIAIGTRLYEKYDEAREFLAYLLMWNMMAAGLPEDQRRWQGEALAQAPYMRETLNYLLVNSMVSADDVQGVRSLVLTELRNSNNDENSRMFALAALMVIGDEVEAAKYAPSGTEPDIADSNIRLNYAGFLIGQEDFHTAVQKIRESITASGDDPELQQELATALLPLYGKDDNQVRAALARAAESTRIVRTVDGALALAYARLFSLTLRQNWLDSLTELAARHPDDFAVQAAAASACLDASDAQAFPHEWLHKAPELPGMADKGREFAEQCSRLAEREQQKQLAALLLARAKIHQSMNAVIEDEATNLQAGALQSLAVALGDPAVDGSIRSERMPETEIFLLDNHVQSRRMADKDFDTRVSSAVKDFLARRRELFEDVLKL